MTLTHENIVQELDRLNSKRTITIDEVFNFLKQLSKNSYIYRVSGIDYHGLLDPNNPSLGGCYRSVFEENRRKDAWQDFLNKKWERKPYTIIMSITGGCMDYGSVYMFERYSEERYEDHSNMTLKVLLKVYRKKCGYPYRRLGGPVRLNKLTIGNNIYSIESSVEAGLKPHWIKLSMWD